MLAENTVTALNENWKLSSFEWLRIPPPRPLVSGMHYTVMGGGGWGEWVGPTPDNLSPRGLAHELDRVTGLASYTHRDQMLGSLNALNRLLERERERKLRKRKREKAKKEKER